MTAAAAPAKKFLLGLPYVAEGPLLQTARALQAPVLLSANAFSLWNVRGGLREWTSFRTKHLRLLDGLEASLDSAGYVAMVRYGGFEWSTNAYLDLCAAYPWRHFSQLDFCCEEAVAGDRETVLDRISMTVRGYFDCRRAAQDRGISDRLMPVLQGRTPDDYARCLDRMSTCIDDSTLIGIGSVCRRPTHGPNGILAIIDRLDDELGAKPTRWHMFGVKSDAAAALRDHPRIASFDSQAYGVHARKRALRDGHSKTNVFLAAVMREWYTTQRAMLDAPPEAQAPRQTHLTWPNQPASDWIERRVARAREEIRELVERGEIDDNWLTDERALAWAFNGDEDDDEADTLSTFPTICRN
jgi:hypothetical protein